MIHDGDIAVERHGDEVNFRRPDGRQIEIAPPLAWSGRRSAPDGVDARSLRVWDGTPFDVGRAIDVLHPRANR